LHCTHTQVSLFTRIISSSYTPTPATPRHQKRPAHHVEPVRAIHIHSCTSTSAYAYAHDANSKHSFGRSDRDDLFSTYNRSTSPSKLNASKPRSPYGAPSGGTGYGYTSPSDAAFGAYPGAPSTGNLYPGGSNGAGPTYGGGRSVTPNSRGQYSAAVLDELESQNDNEHVGALTSKVRQLKDVCILLAVHTRSPRFCRGHAHANAYTHS
jgi:hypothetical protein